MTATVAFVLKGYPRLSETFIAQEIHGLEQRGLGIVIAALRRPTDRQHHPIHDAIQAPVIYLPEFPAREARRVFGAWRRMRTRPGYGGALRQWLADLLRRPGLARVRAFAQALVLADEMPGSVRRLHAHFLHTPASVARYAADILALPWSGSAHAVDIWTTPEAEIRGKLLAADWVVTCSTNGRRYLAGLAPDPGKVELVHHGLDLARLPKTGARASDADGSDPDRPAIVLSVGRAVEKKGFEVLLGALARLPDGLNWRFRHIGGGPRLPALRRQAEILGIADRIEWLGPQARDAVFESYAAADVFVLASRVAENGDRDGLPNVLLEAQAMGLACVSTTVSAIPDLIEHGRSGLLAEPDDEVGLAEALGRMIAEPDLRGTLAAVGVQRVRDRFSHEPGLDRLAAKFGLAASAARACA